MNEYGTFFKKKSKIGIFAARMFREGHVKKERVDRLDVMLFEIQKIKKKTNALPKKEDQQKTHEKDCEADLEWW